MKNRVIAALQQIKVQKPLVHCITNYVTVNDVANGILAVGGSPIMADDAAEVAEITALSKALVLNIGTLNKRSIASMIQAGKTANEQGIPVVLDPVGVGASTLRNQTAERLLCEIQFAVIRGNLSELSYLAGRSIVSHGVDADPNQTGAQGEQVVQALAKRYRCVAAATGAIDLISDGEQTIQIANGHPKLSDITGTGCTTTGLIGSFLGVSTPLIAAVGGIICMGIAGEIAYEQKGHAGNGSYRVAIMDALSLLDADCIVKRERLS